MYLRFRLSLQAVSNNLLIRWLLTTWHSHHVSVEVRHAGVGIIGLTPPEETPQGIFDLGFTGILRHVATQCPIPIININSHYRAHKGSGHCEILEAQK